jgi:hypothetical protein
MRYHGCFGELNNDCIAPGREALFVERNWPHKVEHCCKGHDWQWVNKKGKPAKLGKEKFLVCTGCGLDGT